MAKGGSRALYNVAPFQLQMLPTASPEASSLWLSPIPCRSPLWPVASREGGQQRHVPQHRDKGA